ARADSPDCNSHVGAIDEAQVERGEAMTGGTVEGDPVDGRLQRHLHRPGFRFFLPLSFCTMCAKRQRNQDAISRHAHLLPGSPSYSFRLIVAMASAVRQIRGSEADKGVGSRISSACAATFGAGAFITKFRKIVLWPVVARSP